MASKILLNSFKSTNKEFNKLTSFFATATRCNATSSPSIDPVDESTHTGQKFDKDDYRLARFIDKKKHVNKQFAIDLIDEAAPAPRKERVVWCDGGGGPTGHPKVYINLDKPGNHACGYCGLRFYKEPSHH